MFRASLCPSSGEQECALPHMVFCTGSDGCGCVELGRKLASQECALPHMMFCTGSDGCGCVDLGRKLASQLHTTTAITTSAEHRMRQCTLLFS